MSSRAEGCGQWLSANTKRGETPSVPLKGGKAKKTKKKRLLNLAFRPDSLSVEMSCSPLSPRTVKKLRNAKQTKLNRFFKVDGQSNSRGYLRDNNAASNRKEDQDKRPMTIPVKRQREDSSSGCNTDISQIVERLGHSQENEDHRIADFNISGISHLSDPNDIPYEHGESDFPLVPESDSKRGFLKTRTLTPPPKKQQTCSSDLSCDESNNKNKVDSFSPEQEPSQSFHFSQWKNDQMAKCKEILDGDFTQYNSCTHVDSIRSAGEGSSYKLNRGSAGEMFFETPPFEFTQWAKQQVEACSRIQKEAYSPEITLHKSFNSDEQSDSIKFSPRHSVNQADSEFDFSEWAKNQIKLCKNLQQTEDMAGKAWVDENWDQWIYMAGKVPCRLHLYSEESQFKFTQWMKGQMLKCRNIQENSEWRSPGHNNSSNSKYEIAAPFNGDRSRYV